MQIEATPLKLGISSCLLGEKVRFDGGHKRDPFLVETLGRWVEYVPVCPEVELGLPTPRDALRLTGEAGDERLIVGRSGEDLTERMTAWARKRVETLAAEGLCGFIFKSKSPSSGMERVKLYDRNGVPRKNGVGIFAREFMARFPDIPVEEEGRLHDPVLRETFIEAIFTLRRWRTLVSSGGRMNDLVQYHSRHKYLLLAHCETNYREMGRLVAGQGGLTGEPLFTRYQELLMRTMRRPATVARHTNVLQHAAGYFKRHLDARAKEELGGLITAYREGMVPLIVPVTLLRHYISRYDEPYLREQYYFDPHPLELKLRNHA